MKQTLSKDSTKAVNLEKCTLTELKELLSRQNSILVNKKFINSLRDKGERILVFKSKIEDELKRRDNVDDATNLLSQLNLNSLPNEIEWTGKTELNKNSETDLKDDSDDDVDPLKLVATHSGTQISYRKQEETSQPSLVTSQDIEEAKSFSNDIPSYAQKVCNKFGNKHAKERFIPNQPKQRELARTGFKSSSENVQRRLGKNWEVTAATPPVPVHGGVEEVSLAMSLELQKSQAEKLKEIQLKEAALRLRGSNVKFDSNPPLGNFMKYRTPIDETTVFEGTPQREQTKQPESDSEEIID